MICCTKGVQRGVNVWMASYRGVLYRFDATLSRLEGMELYRIYANYSEKDRKERKVKMTSTNKYTTLL